MDRVSSFTVRKAQQARQMVDKQAACTPGILMRFAVCDVAVNYANADPTEHCLTDSELRASHAYGHVGESIWADYSQCKAYMAGHMVASRLQLRKHTMADQLA